MVETGSVGPLCGAEADGDAEADGAGGVADADVAGCEDGDDLGVEVTDAGSDDAA